MRTNKCGVIADRHIGMVDDNVTRKVCLAYRFRPVVVCIGERDWDAGLSIDAVWIRSMCIFGFSTMPQFTHL